ncbi:V-type proton ATPase subunit S1-like [Patiria miniata]|uniref:V-type proton ATPase subunit S1 n=1 Tax=Patiria miniata TaxID=46514 RepID=A0A914ABR0_PATMI|nr:V-type proton ATPase subunit S1-like [Patiria miniata]
MEGTLKFVLHILAIFSPVLCFGEQPVPLIAWSNTRSFANKPRISAGKLVTREELGTNYMSSILQTQPQNIFLFVFDELSIDDITKYSNAYSADGQGGALSNLKKAMTESLSNLVLPSVEPGDLESDLSSKVTGAVIDLKDPTLEGVTLDPTKTNLVVTRFSVSSGDSKEKAFNEADKLIASMIRGQKTHYTAILTANHKSVLKPQSDDRLTVGRHLLQAPAAEPFFGSYIGKDPDCSIYMTANAFTLTVGPKSSKPKPVTLPTTGWLFSNSSCDIEEIKGKQYLVVKFEMELKTNPQGLNDFKMSLVFNSTVSTVAASHSYFWSVTSASFVEFAVDDGQLIRYDVQTGITDTPQDFSFHCTDSVFTLTQADKGTASAQLAITELQVQPTGVKTVKDVPQFGTANDCVGFFTEGIWMGLFTGLILLLILSFGVGMISNLRVMDKFDDPKGKTITVNVAAE